MTKHLPSFLCGMAAVLVGYALLSELHAQQRRSVVVACADADGRLRVPESPGACPAGQTLVPLTEIEIQPKETPQEDQATADLQRRLRELEDRVKGKGRPLGSPVEAPFEVFNDAGVKIFSVEDASLGGADVKFFNSAGKQVAWIYGSDRGWARTMSATSDLRTELGPDRLTVVNHEFNRYRMELGRNESGRYTLRLFNTTGKVVAGLGQSSADSGVVIVADELGLPRLRMYMAGPQGNDGRVSLLNTEAVEVATLGVDGRQNGLLQLFNGDGVKMVEAGTLDTGIGVVKAGPGAFQPGFGPLGLPGSYIQGRP